jgi:hypothetical protein
MLPKFALCHGYDFAGCRKDDRPRRGGALIEGHEKRHANSAEA